MSVARLEIRRNHGQTDHQSDGGRTVLRGRDPRGRYLRRLQLTIELVAILHSARKLIGLSNIAVKIPTPKFAIFPLFLLKFPRHFLTDDATSPQTKALAAGRRPARLPLGHPFREGQGNVAPRRPSSRRDSPTQADSQRRPRAGLSRQARTRAIRLGGSEPRSVSRSARKRPEENGDGLARHRATAAPGDARRTARK